MAIRAGREGPPSPGSDFSRLTGRKRTVLLAGLPILLVLLGLTFDKTLFLFRLAGAALRSGKNDRSYLKAMADCAYRRPGLLPLLTDEAADPEFLSGWLAAHLRRGDLQIKKKDTAAFLGRVTARFPDNVILEELGLYGGENLTGDWQSFDALFFGMVADPEFNDLSFRALTASVRDGRLPPECLSPLLSYLAWRKNPGLERKLRDWKTSQGIGGEPPAEYPEIPPSALRSALPEAGSQAGGGALRSALARLLKIDPAKAKVGENVIAAAGLADRDSLEKSWEFLDLSSREPFSRGSFAGGPDPQAGGALRVMGFFVRTEPGKVPCRAGFIRKQAVPLGAKTYVLDFFYRTLGRTERPSFWLASPELMPERELDPAAGEWRRVLFVFDNGELGIPSVQPLLRMWGTGTVWFAGLGLYELETGGHNLPPGKGSLFYE
ncbi:MAG: hypothetical protein A2W03_14090 [Candidatus Aminicenantes bacterium RBG_16_63_16]|nr:MAG: hypothetical protein A2W03_14090 [Candidatus Aminicenantes bacterium RBG_16_63_16]